MAVIVLVQKNVKLNLCNDLFLKKNYFCHILRETKGFGNFVNHIKKEAFPVQVLL